MPIFNILRTESLYINPMLVMNRRLLYTIALVDLLTCGLDDAGSSKGDVCGIDYVQADCHRGSC
jgi:hypothetical protein